MRQQFAVISQQRKMKSSKIEQDKRNANENERVRKIEQDKRNAKKEKREIKKDMPKSAAKLADDATKSQKYRNKLAIEKQLREKFNEEEEKYYMLREDVQKELNEQRIERLKNEPLRKKQVNEQHRKKRTEQTIKSMPTNHHVNISSNAIMNAIDPVLGYSV